MELNQNKIEGVTKPIKLWHPRNFLIMGAVFSFLPAALLYALNYGRMGNPQKRNISLMVAFTIFAAIITLILLSTDLYMRYISYGINVALGILMYKDQIDAYRDHIQMGGKTASIIPPLLICIAMAGAMTWASYVSAITPEGVVNIEGDELYYTHSVELSEVEVLANYLVKKGLLLVKDDHSVSVKLDKTEKTYVFSVVILPQYANDDKYTNDFKVLRKQLETDVFKTKVIVELCDDQFNPLKIIDN